MKSDCLVDIRFPFGVMKIILEIEEIRLENTVKTFKAI